MVTQPCHPAAELYVDAGPDAGPEKLDRLAGSLYKDLRALGLFTVRREPAEPPAGAMAGAGEAGAGPQLVRPSARLP